MHMRNAQPAGGASGAVLDWALAPAEPALLISKSQIRQSEGG
jgi:hypothetical protein